MVASVYAVTGTVKYFNADKIVTNDEYSKDSYTKKHSTSLPQYG